jgi:uncharacterized protein with PIN domain
MRQTFTMTLPLAAGLCREAAADSTHAADLLDLSVDLHGEAAQTQLRDAFRALESVAGRREHAQQAIVDALREQGCTWQRVGHLLGITRQAAWERFGKGSHRGRG